jgi:hypothetical protein
VGQQPNIHLGIEDLPRPESHPAPPRRWSPGRPGDPRSPADIEWGGGFGTPGPDSGYAWIVLADRELPMGEGEDPQDIRAAVAALMVARASHFGRAPVGGDADVAEMLLGYRTDGLPVEVIDRIAEIRRDRLPGLGRAKGRARELVAVVDAAALASDPEAIRDQMAAGEVLLG